MGALSELFTHKITAGDTHADGRKAEKPPQKPQAQAKRKTQPKAFDESKIKRDDDGKFGGGSGGGSEKKEDRRFPNRPKVGEVVEKKPTKIGMAKVVVTKSEDKSVDFGEKGGTVVDDAVQMEVRIGRKVIKATKTGTTAEAEREAGKILQKAVENAEKVGKPLSTQSVSHAGKDVEIKIVHDGYGGFHGQLTSTRHDGLPVYATGKGFEYKEPNFEANSREGEFKSEKQAAKVMQKRAQNFATSLAASEAEYKRELSDIEIERQRPDDDDEDTKP